MLTEKWILYEILIKTTENVYSILKLYLNWYTEILGKILRESVSICLLSGFRFNIIGAVIWQKNRQIQMLTLSHVAIMWQERDKTKFLW